MTDEEKQAVEFAVLDALYDDAWKKGHVHVAASIKKRAKRLFRAWYDARHALAVLGGKRW